MKRVLLWVFVSALVCFGNVLHAAEPVAPKAEELTTVQGFQVSITAPSAKFQPGAPITLDSFIKNVTPTKQLLGSLPSLARYQIEVTTSRGEKIPRTRYGQNQYGPRPANISDPYYIEPGDSYKRSLELSRLYDLSESDTYLVKVSFFFIIPPAHKGEAAKDYVLIPSNVLRLTVL